MRKTKIICTLGPATDREGVLEQLAREGMDVARFNFSHGNYEEQKKRLDELKAVRQRLDKPIAALLDTKGPEIRLCRFKEGRVELQEGQEFLLTPEEIEGTQEAVSVTYADLYKDVKPGDSILIDDGLVGLVVERIEGSSVICRVVNGGVISDHKGVNLPGVSVNMPFISQKDREDILFGIREGFDFIAASFTRSAEDVNEIRQILDENGGEFINIIAKIENQQGVDNIDS
ncbi:MAG: pyruvate kinase, partial [Clostridium sp.]|nr:pyruvate kinase [Clostridium sp.]